VIASLSLDLDNQWSYMKTHGDSGWRSFPSYLDVVVPRVLDILKSKNLTITFFVVGQDAAIQANHDALASIAAAGHEIGNHSFRHEPWLHLYGAQELMDEIAEAEECIERATGKRPRGFRGPGFSHSPAVLETLVKRGYAYDASTFPTFIGPLARAYYFMKSGPFDAAETEKRKSLFGSVRDGFRPLKPHSIATAAGDIIEMPVTTMPGLRLPFHVSYLLYASGVSRSLALGYFRSALALCRMSGTQPSLLLHPLDFLGCDDVRELAFFPAMNVPSIEKVSFVSEVLALYAAEFSVVPVGRHAQAWAG
jgi:hypothetical protein